MKITIDVDEKQVEKIIGALMDNYGIIALHDEVVQDLAEWAIRYQAFALSMGSTAELNALANRLTERAEA